MWCLSISYWSTTVIHDRIANITAEMEMNKHKLGRRFERKHRRLLLYFVTVRLQVMNRVKGSSWKLSPSSPLFFISTSPTNEINNKMSNKCYSTIHSLRRPVNNSKPHHPQHCLAIFSPKTGDSHRFGLTFCRSIGSCSVCLLRE